MPIARRRVIGADIPRLQQRFIPPRNRPVPLRVQIPIETPTKGNPFSEKALVERAQRHEANRLENLDRYNYLQQTATYKMDRIEPPIQEVNRYRAAFEQSSSDSEDYEYDFKKRYPDIFALYGYEF